MHPQTYKLGVFKEKMRHLSSHLEIKRTVDSGLKYHSWVHSHDFAL